MAYDLWGGKNTARDWSMGGDFAFDHASSAVAKRIPWVPIAIGAAALGAFALLPSRHHAHASSTGRYPRARRVTSPTMKVQAMTNEEMARLDPENVYGSRRN